MSDNPYVLRLTREQKRLMLAAAKRANKSLSQWARDEIRLALAAKAEKAPMINYWHYSENGQSVIVQTPHPINPQLYDRLRGYVNEVLKPPLSSGGCSEARLQ